MRISGEMFSARIPSTDCNVFMGMHFAFMGETRNLARWEIYILPMGGVCVFACWGMRTAEGGFFSRATRIMCNAGEKAYLVFLVYGSDLSRETSGVARRRGSAVLSDPNHYLQCVLRNAFLLRGKNAHASGLGEYISCSWKRYAL